MKPVLRWVQSQANCTLMRRAPAWSAGTGGPGPAPHALPDPGCVAEPSCPQAPGIGQQYQPLQKAVLPYPSPRPQGPARKGVVK